MKKTSTLQQKLKSYSAVAGAVAATAAVTDAKAQIIYTDVTPDVTLTADTTGQVYDLDLNNDGTADFTIVAVSGVYPYGTMQLPYNWVFAYSATPTTNQMDTLVGGGNATAAHNMNDNIGAANMWDVGYSSYNLHLFGLDFTTLGFTAGNWLGATDKYAAIKFDISGSTHYGWARMSMAADASTITIKDYAYNGVANVPLLAGQTVGITDVTLNNVKVFAANKQVNVNLGDAKDAVITIHDVMGREVSSMNLAGGSTMIDLSTEANGIYTVSINTAAGRSVTKVAIK